MKDYKAIKSDHTQREMDAIYKKQEEIAHSKMNPSVESVSLWKLHGNKHKK